MVGMMRILITGCDGFIGRNLVKYFSGHHLVYGVSREDLNLLDGDAVKKFFEGKNYHLVIHTDVEGGRRTKPDTEEMFYNNILMVYNLLANQEHFDRIITFGSGAELDRRLDINTETDDTKRYPIDFYGMAKSVTHKLCLAEPKLYNFRIFNCFGEDESSDRMIRGNVEKYVRREPMTLFSNRLMDFFYIEDLGLMVEYFLKTPFFPYKIVNCTYDKHIRLKDVMEIINNLNSYDVPIIEVNDESTNKINVTKTDYVGDNKNLPLDFLGIEGGIKRIYQSVLERYINA